MDAEPVLAVIQDPVSPLLVVHLSDGSALTVTADHPFWVDGGLLFTGRGWLTAGQLLPGDRLRTASGRDATVAGVRRGAEQAVVYTLTVARDHTFFVGNARVLVHNATCPALRLTRTGLTHVIWRHLNASNIAQALAAGGKVSPADLASNISTAGQFLPNVTPEELKNLITDAFSEANRLNSFAVQTNGYYRADATLSHVIGRTGSGGTLTSVVRIVVRPDGTLVTIFPV